jgi:hypothetical protein
LISALIELDGLVTPRGGGRDIDGPCARPSPSSVTTSSSERLIFALIELDELVTPRGQRPGYRRAVRAT